VVLKPEEGERIGRPPTDNIEAYDIFLQIRSSLWPPTRENLLTARSAYHRIIEIDPGFAGGHAGQSLTHSLVVMFGISENPQKDLKLAMELANKAVEIDNWFAQAYSALGIALTASGQLDEAIAKTQRGVELQPGDADVHLYSALSRFFAGQAETAYDAISTAIRLDPQYVRGPYLNVLGIVCFCAERYQEAIDVFKRNIDRGGPIGPPALAFRTAAYEVVGQLEAAKESAQELLEFFPAFTLTSFRMPNLFRESADAERVISALRKAGLPE
jgi:tetratricopeptide (TPR) repeat protein